MVDTRRQSPPRLVADNTQAQESPDFIGESLRRLYRSTEAEPLPPHLRALLDRLAAEEAAERVGGE